MNAKNFQAALARAGEPQSVVALVGKHADAIVKEFNKKSKAGMDDIAALKAALHEGLPKENKRTADHLALRSALLLNLIAEEASGQKTTTPGAES